MYVSTILTFSFKAVRWQCYLDTLESRFPEEPANPRFLEPPSYSNQKSFPVGFFQSFQSNIVSLVSGISNQFGFTGRCEKSGFK